MCIRDRVGGEGDRSVGAHGGGGARGHVAHHRACGEGRAHVQGEGLARAPVPVPRVRVVVAAVITRAAGREREEDGGEGQRTAKAAIDHRAHGWGLVLQGRPSVSAWGRSKTAVVRPSTWNTPVVPFQVACPAISGSVESAPGMVNVPLVTPGMVTSRAVGPPLMMTTRPLRAPSRSEPVQATWSLRVITMTPSSWFGPALVKSTRL